MEFKEYIFRNLDKAANDWPWYVPELKENKLFGKTVTAKDCAEHWILTMAQRVLIPENVKKINPKELLEEWLKKK